MRTKKKKKKKMIIFSQRGEKNHKTAGSKSKRDTKNGFLAGEVPETKNTLTFERFSAATDSFMRMKECQ